MNWLATGRPGVIGAGVAGRPGVIVLGQGFQKMVWQELPAGHHQEWLALLALNDLGLLDC
jgi:hypothetical protein